MGRKKHNTLYRKRGLVQMVVVISLWFILPSSEKRLLEIMSLDPSGFSSFGHFLTDIVSVLLNYWWFISLIILVESLYAILERRSLVYDLVTRLKELISDIEKKL